MEEDLSFEAFWSVYPRRDNKKKARTTWDRLSKKKRRLALEDCQVRYKATERQYVPMPTTYLNGERWEDELPKQVRRSVLPQHQLYQPEQRDNVTTKEEGQRRIADLKKNLRMR